MMAVISPVRMSLVIQMMTIIQTAKAQSAPYPWR
jgi:hypothetical protein